MPDPPLLTPKAKRALRDAIGTVPRHSDGSVEAARGIRAFLAAQDPDALARRFEEERVTSLEVRFLREFARWLGLGDDDA